MILADLAFRGYGFADLAKFVVIVAAIVAIVYIALKVMGVTVPPWLVQIAVVVLVAVVALFAIGLVASL